MLYRILHEYQAKTRACNMRIVRELCSIIYASLESFLRRALVVIEAVALVWKYVRFVKSQSGSDFGFNSGFMVRSIILPTCRGLVLYRFYKI